MTEDAVSAPLGVALRSTRRASWGSLRHVPAGAVIAGVAGVAAGAGLLAFYLGLITFAQGWDHAVDQLAADRWYVGAIMLGFGTQVALFVFLRGLHARRLRGAAGGTAASTGTSAAAMLACCAHHLADVFTVLGIAGAATFLTEYKVPLLWLGIGMNGAGVTYLVTLIRDARRSAPACH
ncbi:MAG TPA: hypothetical protein VFX49_21145 [Chloroflexota bacterium]|nr:hypothetical protein [Chloroflexota bacterium]